MTIPKAHTITYRTPSQEEQDELNKYYKDLAVFGSAVVVTNEAIEHALKFKHIPLKDIHRETLNLPALYEQSPLIVNAYTDEMDMLSYYDVQKWISENKELVQAMLDGGDA